MAINIKPPVRMALAALESHHLSLLEGPVPPPLKALLLPQYGYVDFVRTGAPTPAPRTIWSIPPDGLTLEEPGRYRLAACIEWRAAAPTAVALTIASPGVTLDFDGKTLTCLEGGVAVWGELVSDATVENGQITGARKYGIFFAGCEAASVLGMEICNVRNRDPTVLTASIHVVACPGSTVRDCTISRVSATGTTVAGIAAIASPDSTVSNCHIDRLANKAGVCAGILHILCLGVTVTDCRIDDLRTYPNENLHTNGHTCIGVLPTACIGVWITKTSVRRVAGSCDDTHGISVFLCAHAAVADCALTDISTGNWGAWSSAKSTGVEVYGTDCTVTDCVAKNISAKCPGDRQCTGFSVARAADVRFRRCRAMNVRVTDLAGRESVARYGYGAGFGWAPDPRPFFRQVATRVRYEQCVAESCQVGFDTFYHVDSVWQSPRSVGNDRDIWNCDCRERQLSCNLCSECPVPIDICLTNRARGNEIYCPRA